MDKSIKIDIIFNLIIYTFLFLIVFQNLFIETLFKNSNSPSKQSMESAENKLVNQMKLVANETKKLNKTRSILEKERIQSERIIISKMLEKQIKNSQKLISGLNKQFTEYEKQVTEYKKQVTEYRTLRDKRKNYFYGAILFCIFIVLLTRTIYLRKLASR